MDQLIVKTAIWMLAIETALVVAFVLVNYAIRLYHYLLMRDKQNINDKIKGLSFFYIKSQSVIKNNDMVFFNKNILSVLKVMEGYDVAEELKTKWGEFRQYLILNLFYPKGKELYRSWRPYKRYYAARCFFAHYEASDAEMVIKLISDPVLLVSLNASRVAFKYHSPELINASIDVFSKYRKIRQSIYSTIAHQHSADAERIVIDRMRIEKDPFVKAFCYRLLQQLPTTENISDMIMIDLSPSETDLQVSALHYCALNPIYYHYLDKFINNEKWQLRATAAELIGKIKYVEAIPELEKRLSDHEWWVRIRTAEALGKLGNQGVSVLLNQTMSKDRYAYEAAQQVLDAILSKVGS